ncbi:LytTR family DNA-binding domain-containing protein [Rhodocytophaga aerolata]|uniref:LytTR family DNA-binding domain-containing protein n=1 Tax=Rhodocytophaga aerolata TaxID=455078 RepID=A0ABT8RH30_9BACT|nr:LytTR family DNA-binding domain-containing protein [Rhodocytophaga aerolata]MDO1451409.1 LytTR family DNA-binding domain-containing protein [Rhodocytophaga aerolata]
MLKAIIIDDEPDCVALMALQLKAHCPGVRVVLQTTQPEEGLEAIRDMEPDLVFLDVEMPRMNGFSLLEKLDEIPLGLIFVTAYNEFALKAFRFSALDYLLKPINSTHLCEAVRKAEKRQRTDSRQLDMLRYQLKEGQLPSKIAVPFQSGVVFVELKELVYCQADSNYTRLFLTNGKNYLLSKTLRDVQEVLEERNFLRVHRQYLINLEHIKMYHKGDGSYLVMTGDVTLPLAKNQKDRLVEKFGWL